MAKPAARRGHDVETVNSVMLAEGDDEVAEDAAFRAAERAAIMAEGEQPARPAVVPPSDLVERMAEAMAVNPAIRLINRETAMAYFRGEALRRLALANQDES